MREDRAKVEPPPCPVCLGPLHYDHHYPCSGRKYGVEERICHRCYMQFRNEWLRRTTKACDLCGSADPAWRVDGEPWGIEGKVCPECRADLEEERWMATPVEPQPATFRIPQALPVLGGEFIHADLIPRAAVRLILADPNVRRVFKARRATG